MTGLLVSVRNASEALEAYRAGADLIDVKEPDRGPLGRADWEVWREVIRVLPPQAPLSFAAGELLELEFPKGEFRRPNALIKVGLSGCRDRLDWTRMFREFVEQVTPRFQPIAVVYADGPQCAAPHPERVIREAEALRCAGVLFDTTTKDGRSLFDFLSCDDLESLVTRIRQAGMRVALAGSLNVTHIPAILALRPDYLAVRGAVCERSRTSRIDAGKVACLKRVLLGQSTPEGGFSPYFSGKK